VTGEDGAGLLMSMSSLTGCLFHSGKKCRRYPVFMKFQSKRLRRERHCFVLQDGQCLKFQDCPSDLFV
jgi:hypothetical protein